MYIFQDANTYLERVLPLLLYVGMGSKCRASVKARRGRIYKFKQW